MYKVFKFENMSQAAPYMDAQVFDYINGCESESFESLSGFDLIAYDYFDKSAPESAEEKIMVYLDKIWLMVNIACIFTHLKKKKSDSM